MSTNSKRKVIRYTQEEDNLIIETITKGKFVNLQQAFELLATKMPGRSAAGISYRYQNYLKNNKPMFFTGNYNGVVQNRKVVKRDQKPDWKPFQSVVKQMLDMPKSERDKVMNFFKD